MNVWVRTTIFAASAAVLAASAVAQNKAESRLAGIRLYDSGVDVVRKLGSPTDVIAITFNTGNNGGGGGMAAGGGGGSRGGFAPAPMGGGPGSSNFIVPPLSFDQVRKNVGGGGGGQGGPTPVGGPAPVGGRGGGGGTTGVTDTQYVRWVYRRANGGSLNVVLNKFNKVVQIEAIGIANKNIRTARGVTLGSSLATVIKQYHNPDAYEVGDNYFMVRFLQTFKVAFRLTRESAKSPYVVTGIVVSAGKA